jgi:hypothetical protein
VIKEYNFRENNLTIKVKQMIKIWIDHLSNNPLTAPAYKSQDTCFCNLISRQNCIDRSIQKYLSPS